MWRKLRDRTRARRAAKSSNAPPATPPSNDNDTSLPTTSALASPHILRSPSLPYPTASSGDANQPAVIINKAASTATETIPRARTDMGTRSDKSVLSHSEDDTPNGAVQMSSVTIASEGYRRLSLDGDLPPSAIRPDDRTHQINTTPIGAHQHPNPNLVNELIQEGDGEQQRGEREGGEGGEERNSRDGSEVDSEGVFDVDTNVMLPYVVDVSACSEAGWEPMRGHVANVPPTHRVEVRKENQDAYCVFLPFIANNTATATTENETATNEQVLQMFLGVFDGHGAQGRPIAHYARDFISVVCRDAASHLANPSSASSPSQSSTTSASATSTSAIQHRPSYSKTGATTHRARLDTLKAAFSRAERALTESDCGIDHVYSGTTAIVCWLFGNELYTAWSGDSRAVIGRAVSNGSSSSSNAAATNASTQQQHVEKYKGIDLSYDQKPSRSDEKRRVRAAGGRIARWQRNMGPLRVWLPGDWTPGLAMTRSIGDTVLSEYGVSPVPEVSYCRISKNDEFIVLASDGVWEFMTSQQVIDFVGIVKKDGRCAEEASTLLVNEAVRRWRRNEVVVDDTTAVVMYINCEDALESENNKMKMNNMNHHNSFTKSIRSKVSSLNLKNYNNHASVHTGVYNVSDTGHLTDFVCKNDSYL